MVKRVLVAGSLIPDIDGTMREIPATFKVRDLKWGRAVLIIEPAEDVHEGAAIANLLGRIVTFYAFQRQVGDEDD
jgi:hypothetical protein